MNFREQLRELATLKGSIGVGLFFFFACLFSGRWHEPDLSAGAIGYAVVWAAYVVIAVQLAVRLNNARRDYALLALASAGLFLAMVGRTIIDGTGGSVDWAIATAIWAGISLAALAMLVVYRKT